MDDKGLNATGLAHIWKAITQVFATKEYVDDELAKVDTSGGSTGGSTGGSEPFVIDITVDGDLCARHNGIVAYNDIANAVRQDPNNVYFRVFYEDPAEYEDYEGTEWVEDLNYFCATTPLAVLRYAGMDTNMTLFFSGMAVIPNGGNKIIRLGCVRMEHNCDLDGYADLFSEDIFV